MPFAKGHVRLNKNPPWNKGLTADIDTRLASGERHGLYGKHHSEETKTKIRVTRREGLLNGRIKTRRGQKNSAESKEKDRQAHLGIPCSPRCRANLLEAAKRPKTEEHKRKIALGNLGKTVSMETREKIRQAATIRMKGPGNPNWGKHESTETKALISQAMKQRWLINRDLEIKRTALGRKARPTKLERKVMQLLYDNNLPFEYVGDGKVVLGGIIPDFINVNGKKEIIEALGCYWHGCQVCYPGSKSQKLGRPDVRGAIYHKFGFHMFPIWEHEMKEPNKILIKLNNWMKSHNNEKTDISSTEISNNIAREEALL